MGTPVPVVTEPSHTYSAVECLPSPACLPVCPWQLSAASGPPLSRPQAVCRPPPLGLTLTPPLSSSEPEPRQWEWRDPGLELDPCLDPSSLDTQGIQASNSSCFLTQSWDSLSPRPWVSSVCILRCPGVFLVTAAI